MLHVHVHRVLEDLYAVKPVRSFRILSFLFLKNTFTTFEIDYLYWSITTFEMIICIGVSTNNYKLSEISLMHRLLSFIHFEFLREK